MPKTPDKNVFDEFAERASGAVARAPFFAICVLMVLVWAPSYFVFRNLDTWQLIINTTTTIITFLMVALLENSAHRDSVATHAKLDALAQALADLMEERPGMEADVAELQHAVGVEQNTGTAKKES